MVDCGDYLRLKGPFYINYLEISILTMQSDIKLFNRLVLMCDLRKTLLGCTLFHLALFVFISLASSSICQRISKEQVKVITNTCQIIL